jgi:hypothetical protein
VRLRVLHNLADLSEELQSLGHAQPCRVAVLRHRHALNVFHYEDRPGGFGHMELTGELTKLTGQS